MNRFKLNGKKRKKEIYGGDEKSFEQSTKSVNQY